MRHTICRQIGKSEESSLWRIKGVSSSIRAQQDGNLLRAGQKQALVRTAAAGISDAVN